VDQLSTEAHDQQQRRIGITTDALIRQVHVIELGHLRGNINIASRGRKRRQAAQERSQKK
jgi:hypothetical protein